MTNPGLAFNIGVMERTQERMKASGGQLPTAREFALDNAESLGEVALSVGDQVTYGGLSAGIKAHREGKAPAQICIEATTASGKGFVDATVPLSEYQTIRSDKATGWQKGTAWARGVVKVAMLAIGVATAAERLSKAGKATTKTGSNDKPEAAPSESPQQSGTPGLDVPGDDLAPTLSADVDFTADLSRTRARSRSGHSYAGNKQLHEAMLEDPAARARMEARYGADVVERTSTSDGGRRNPRGGEWDHNSADSTALDLKTAESHLEKTKTEGREGGGWKRFHRDKGRSAQ
jgi:hypothetical protein